MKFSAMFIVGEFEVQGLESYEALDFMDAVKIALLHADRIGGRLVRVESCDFGAFEFMR